MNRCEKRSFSEPSDHAVRTLQLAPSSQPSLALPHRGTPPTPAILGGVKREWSTESLTAPVEIASESYRLSHNHLWPMEFHSSVTSRLSDAIVRGFRNKRSRCSNAPRNVIQSNCQIYLALCRRGTPTRVGSFWIVRTAPCGSEVLYQ